ncbi:fimbrial protein [Enterobacter roggenkampii]|uniref:fimbrial protein n=1 Tax=Enterobacter roggenkampii TaxID=1812935 RepID=UPI000DA22F85|nr:fimbrial protein [Enterobacter roggenkampii]
MKLNKIMLASVMVAGMSSFAHAAEPSQGHGKVTFQGEIIDAPCSVAPDSIDQTVDLGQIAKVSLQNGGESEPRQFSIKLENCDFGDPAAKNKVTTTFNGVSVPDTNNKLLNISGNASGAGVGMRTFQGEDIVLGTGTTAQTLTGDGNNELQFTAFLKGVEASGAVITEGKFEAVTNFELAYN